jgi:hypothetical protein
MTTLVAFGLTQLFRGARRGQPLVAGAGAAILLIGLARRSSKKDKLLLEHTLADGEGLSIRLERGRG